MSIHPAMPACEALAAAEARYLFSGMLQDLLSAKESADKQTSACRIGGYLGGLMECQVITAAEYTVMRDEISNFVWGPRP